MMIFFFIMTSSVIIIYSVSIYIQQRRFLLDNYGKEAAGCAACVASIFQDKDELARLKGYKEKLTTDDHYDDIQNRITNFKNAMNITYVYVFYVQNGQEVYLIDAMDDTIYTYQLGDVEHEIYPLAVKIFQTGQFIKGYETQNTDRYGSLVTSYAPIYDERGKLIALVGADYRMGNIFRELNEFIGVTVAQATLVFFIFVFVAFWWVNRRVVRPIVHLANSMDQFARSQHSSAVDGYLVHVNTGDEIEQLADSYNTLLGRIDRYIMEIQNSVLVRERAKGELDAARTIQRGILPQKLPPTPKLPTITAVGSLKPAREIGGDLFDLFALGQERVALVIGDVSGKGIPAALFMAITQTLQRSIALMEKDPASVAMSMNRILAVGNRSRMFVTWWTGHLDLKTGRMNYVNAGHNPPLLRRSDGSVHVLEEHHGRPLALIKESRYSSSTIDLEAGDLLVLYTDGLTENRVGNETFGLNRLIDIIRGVTDNSPDAILEKIKEKVDEFTHGKEAMDDLTLLLVRYDGQSLESAGEREILNQTIQ